MDADHQREYVLRLHAMGGSDREISKIVSLGEGEIRKIIRKATELPNNFYEAQLIAHAQKRAAPVKLRRRRPRQSRRDIANAFDAAYRSARERGASNSKALEIAARSI